MNSTQHFNDTRELLDWGVSAVTFRDVMLAPLVDEQGGGGAETPIRFTAAQRARMATVEPLTDGSFATSDPAASGIADRIEEWLRSRLPVTLGGK